MILLGNKRSMLIPNPWDAEWTATNDIFCDQWPNTPGVGSAITAMQALGLTPAQAAALSSSSQPGQPITATQIANGNGNAAPPEAVPGTRLPIPPTVNSQLQLLAGDPNLAFLLIQNNEATGGGTLLISTDPINTATPAYYLNFPPGSNGLLWDRSVLNNPIYAGWTGAPTKGGVIFYGSRPKQGQGPPAPGLKATITPTALPGGWGPSSPGWTPPTMPGWV